MRFNSIDEGIIRAELQKIVDPELGINLVDLGLIYRIDVRAADVRVTMTLTTPGCPMHESLVRGAQRVLQNLPGIGTVTIDLVWDPPWTPERMSDRAKMILGARSLSVLHGKPS